MLYWSADHGGLHCNVCYMLHVQRLTKGLCVHFTALIISIHPLFTHCYFNPQVVGYQVPPLTVYR